MWNKVSVQVSSFSNLSRWLLSSLKKWLTWAYRMRTCNEGFKSTKWKESLLRQTDRQANKQEGNSKTYIVSFCFHELLLQTLPMEIKLQLSFCLLSSPANQSYFPSSFSESYLLHSNWEIFNYSPARFKQKSPFSSLKINTSLECQGVDFLRNVEVINLTEGSIWVFHSMGMNPLFLFFFFVFVFILGDVGVFSVSFSRWTGLEG